MQAPTKQHPGHGPFPEPAAVGSAPPLGSRDDTETAALRRRVESMERQLNAQAAREAQQSAAQPESPPELSANGFVDLETATRLDREVSDRLDARLAAERVDDAWALAFFDSSRVRQGSRVVVQTARERRGRVVE